MRIASLADVKAKLSAYVDMCQTSPVVITRNGRPVALITPLNEQDLDSIKLTANPKFIAMLERSYASYKSTGGIPHDEFWGRAKSTSTKPASAKKVARKKLEEVATAGASARSGDCM